MPRLVATRLGQYLAKRVEGCFGRRYLELVGCGLGEESEYSWVSRFLRDPSKESDPIRHLLLLRAVGSRIVDLRNAREMFDAERRPVESESV
jgi:hypothetical protein